MKRAKDVWTELAPHAEVFKESAQNAAASRIHALAGNELAKMLGQLGKRGRDMVIEEDYVPAWIRAMGLRMFDNLWPDIEREMYETAMQQLGRQLNVYRELLPEDSEPVPWKPTVARSVTVSCSCRLVEGPPNRAPRSSSPLQVPTQPVHVHALPVRQVNLCYDAQPVVDSLHDLLDVATLRLPASLLSRRLPLHRQDGRIPGVVNASLTSHRRLRCSTSEMSAASAFNARGGRTIAACIAAVTTACLHVPTQLVAYILEFKAFSSLSVGFLLTAMGAAEDHICITYREDPFCDEFGPGVRPVFLWETFCFMMQAACASSGMLLQQCGGAHEPTMLLTRVHSMLAPHTL